MSQYIVLAEKIFNNIKENLEMSNKPLKILTLIIRDIRAEAEKSSLKINTKVYAAIDHPERNKIVDLSLMPRIDNEDEFLLWLAGFIEKITIDDLKEKLPPLSTLIKKFPKSSFDKIFLPNGEDAEREIKKYFDELKIKRLIWVNYKNIEEKKKGVTLAIEVNIKILKIKKEVVK